MKEDEIIPAQASILRIKYLRDFDGLVYKQVSEEGKKYKIKHSFRPHYKNKKPAGMIRFLKNHPGRVGTFWYEVIGWPYIVKHKKCVPVNLGLRDSFSNYRQL